jgi:hypothetical protein
MEASLGYVGRYCLKNKTKHKNQNQSWGLDSGGRAPACLPGKQTELKLLVLSKIKTNKQTNETEGKEMISVMKMFSLCHYF